MRRMVPVNWWVLPWWILASAAGYAVGGAIESAAGPLEGVTVIGYVTAGGAAAAVLQWLALRRHVARAGHWIGTAIVGGAVVAVVSILAGVLAGLAAGAVGDAEAGRAFGEDVAGVSAAILYGIAVGMLQGRLLRRHFARAGRWVLVSAVGWIVAGLTAGVTEGVAGWAVLGAVYGALTGGVLVALLRQTPDETPAGEE
ncbi:MAG: hypothetical protein F4004_10395 [Acidimicrobiia bacterium]|nr:hypothetical protein [Acidimicrobiia bacterium]MYC44648.1 hypothetical protein [Acidimicrobiia bacterium]